MRIALGNDHRGYHLKKRLVDRLQGEGYVVLDLGAHDAEPSDHPLFAQAVGEAVAGGEADLGICICGSGIGVSIAANKVPGAYAALVWNPELARLCRQHNGANILCLAADFTAAHYAELCVRAFLEAEPDPAERYERRRAQVAGYAPPARVE
ncbi:MAG TPA: RpiB/LacA/LacB family sugar-phosphate isomerase [bacterium]|nr:RpiB/LacA/LacB family sugar-phosphate isomerase [bacterium]